MGDLALAPLALVAGVLAFTTPCCLPMIPGFVSYVSALGGDADDPAIDRSLALRAGVLFTAGFGLAFTTLGTLSGLAGAAALRHVPALLRLVGLVFVGLGAQMALGISLVPARWRIDHGRQRTRGAFLLGAGFGLGFIPAVGPALATLFSVSGNRDTAVQGAVLLLVFSVGFGLPYVGLALGLHRLGRALDWLHRHRRLVQAAGGSLLAGVGLLFLTGQWQTIFIPFYRALSRLNWPPI